MTNLSLRLLLQTYTKKKFHKIYPKTPGLWNINPWPPEFWSLNLYHFFLLKLQKAIKYEYKFIKTL